MLCYEIILLKLIGMKVIILKLTAPAREILFFDFYGY